MISPTSMYRGENYIETNQTPADILTEGLIRIARDATGPFCIAAIQRLGMFGPAASNAVPALLPMIHDSNPMMRHMAIRALGQIKSQPDIVIPALTNLLSDPDPGSQTAAVSALHGFGYNAQFQPHIP